MNFKRFILCFILYIFLNTRLVWYRYSMVFFALKLKNKLNDASTKISNLDCRYPNIKAGKVNNIF